MALWHERDISHSSTERIILPDACLVLDYAMSVFTSVMRDLNIYKRKMADNIKLTHGVIYSQRVMLALIDKGLSRQQAYQITQRHAMKSWKDGQSFLKLLQEDAQVGAHLTGRELEGIFDPQYYLRYVDEIFQRLGLTESQWPDDINLAATEELSADNDVFRTG